MANTEGMSSHGSGRSPGQKRETREVVRIVVAAVAVILLVAFVLDNSQTVKVGFVFFNAQLSLIWVLLIAALLGAGADRLVILVRRRRRAAAAKRG
jgi:uncharacterized integral membrane protein